MKEKTKRNLDRATALLVLVSCDLAEIKEDVFSKRLEAIVNELHAIQKDIVNKEWGT